MPAAPNNASASFRNCWWCITSTAHTHGQPEQQPDCETDGARRARMVVDITEGTVVGDKEGRDVITVGDKDG